MSLLLELFRFVQRICVHWGALVTGGFFIAALDIYQGTGHPLQHWVSWTVAGICAFLAVFLTWREQEQKIATLAARIQVLESPASSALGSHPEREPTKPNVQCLGVEVGDGTAKICFRNVETPGKPVGDFRGARLKVEYFLDSSGEEVATVFPARWIGYDQDAIAIDFVPRCAVLAVQIDIGWCALSTTEIPSENSEAGWKWNVERTALPAARLRIKATLIGENNLSILPVVGVLELCENGNAKFEDG